MNGAPLTLYNSLTRAMAVFEPIDPTDVRVYSCGPTVYHYAHIGNLRAYVFTDTLSRVLTAKYGRVRHIINITDVGHLTSDADAGDDKMEAAAKASGRDVWDISRHYTAAFKRNLAELNILPPTDFPLATDHIDEMIAWGEAIETKHCYRLPDGLYFDTTTVPNYGALARQTADDRESRIDPVAGKRNPADFAIWRTSGADEHRQMEWPSPWGRGAPGWHLECSVMSAKYLGPRFDIHTGGIDHREIHHPNEIAQNQAHCGCPNDPGFTGATFWMHNNFLVERSGKMSKSAGDVTTLQTLIDRGFHPIAYRLMCLQAQYRSEMEFSWEGLAAAFTRLKRLVIAANFFLPKDGFSGEGDHSAPADAEQAFLYSLDDAMSEDLNTPKALTVLDQLLNDTRISPYARRAVLTDFDAVLGLDLTTLRREDLRIRPATATIDETQIAARLAERREARAAKDFPRSDAIRNDLAAAGVEVMDGDPLGWDWRIS